MPHTQDRKGLALLLLCAVQFMVVLDIAIVNVALPTIKTALSFDETSLSWVINAYTLTFGGLLMLGGRTADLLGRRRMFIAGLALFSGASLALSDRWAAGSTDRLLSHFRDHCSISWEAVYAHDSSCRTNKIIWESRSRARD